MWLAAWEKAQTIFLRGVESGCHLCSNVTAPDASRLDLSYGAAILQKTRRESRDVVCERVADGPVRTAMRGTAQEPRMEGSWWLAESRREAGSWEAVVKLDPRVGAGPPGHRLG